MRALPPAEQAERLLAYRWSSLPGNLAASKEESFVDYAARRELSGDPVEARHAYRNRTQGQTSSHSSQLRPGGCATAP